MRLCILAVATVVSLGGVGQAEAKSLSKKEIEMCRWGSEMARSAQQSKLSGSTLYSARQKLKSRKFSQPWMPKMAVGITEQTYASKSPLKPWSVKKAYYDGCIHHELVRKPADKKQVSIKQVRSH